MWNPWAISIIVIAGLALIASWDLPRARRWIFLGMASFFASSLMWDYGDKHLHPVFTFICDALVCVAIHRGAREKWELPIYIAFLLSVTASSLRMGLILQSNLIYASVLELCNYASLIWIGSTGIMERVGRAEGSLLHHVRRDLRRTYRSL